MINSGLQMSLWEIKWLAPRPVIKIQTQIETLKTDLFFFISCWFLLQEGVNVFVKVPKISQEVKIKDIIQGAQYSFLAILFPPLLNVVQSKVFVMIPVILADLLRQIWLRLLSVLPFVGSIPAIYHVRSFHVYQKSFESQIVTWVVRNVNIFFA